MAEGIPRTTIVVTQVGSGAALLKSRIPNDVSRRRLREYVFKNFPEKAGDQIQDFLAEVVHSYNQATMTFCRWNGATFPTTNTLAQIIEEGVVLQNNSFLLIHNWERDMRRELVNPPATRWPGPNIPYYVDPAFGAQDDDAMVTIGQVIEEYNDAFEHGFQLEHREQIPTAGTQHIQIRRQDPHEDPSICGSSSVGMNPVHMGPNIVELTTNPTCGTLRGNMCHETGHSIIFEHTHQKYIASKFLKFRWTNIPAGDFRDDFAPCSPTMYPTGGIDFCDCSVMNYGRRAGSSIVMEWRGRPAFNDFGNKEHLCIHDIQYLNFRYP